MVSRTSNASSTAFGGDSGRGSTAAPPASLASLSPELVALRAEVRRGVGEERFERYFADPRSLRLERAGADGPEVELVVTVPSPMMAALVQKHMRPVLEEALRGVTRRTEARVRFEVRGQLSVAEPAPRAARPAVAVEGKSAGAGAAARRMARVARGPAGLPVGLRYRLADMVVSSSNRLAHGAAVAMAAEVGRGSVSQPGQGAETLSGADGSDGAGGRLAMLYVHGRCGVGKTHLLQGAAADAFAAAAGRAVRYVSAEAFATEFITAVRNKAMDGFRRTYRYLDLLCIDDLGGLSGKPATQSELQATLDAVLARGGRVMAAGAGHPRTCAGLTEGLRSRLSSGLVAELGPADEEMAERVVSALAVRRGLVLEPGAARGLVRLAAQAAGGGDGRAAVSVRELEGAVTKVEAVYRLLGDQRAGGRVGLVCIERALRPAADAGVERATGAVAGAAGAGVESAARSPRMVRMDHIVEEVCRALGVSREEVHAKGRHVRVVLARAMSTHLARKLTTLSYPEIARALGRPNHSTVITAAQRLDGQLAANGVVDLGPGRGQEPLVALRDRLIGSMAAGQ